MLLPRYFLGILASISMCVGNEFENKEGFLSLSNPLIRVAMHCAVETPLNNIATTKVTKELTALNASKDIFRTQGMTGFYNGEINSLGISLIWYWRMRIINDPFQIMVPRIKHFSSDYISDSSMAELKKQDGLYYRGAFTIEEYDPKVSKAADLAILEMYYMPLLQFQEENFKELMKHVLLIDRKRYAGSTCRSMALFTQWHSFFKIKDSAEKIWKDNPIAQIGAVTATQMLVGAAVSPLYVFMTQQQQQLQNPWTGSLVDPMRHAYLTQGTQAFIRSAKVGAIHAGIQAAFTLAFMKLVEKEK